MLYIYAGVEKKKKKKKINVILYISFGLPSLFWTTNVLLPLTSSIVQKLSYTVTYIWLPLQTEETNDLANYLKTTLILFIKTISQPFILAAQNPPLTTLAAREQN